jgi:hypothetical protein
VKLDFDQIAQILERSRVDRQDGPAFLVPPAEDIFALLAESEDFREVFAEIDRDALGRKAARLAAVAGPITAESLKRFLVQANLEHRSSPLEPYALVTTLSTRLPDDLSPRAVGSCEILLSESLPPEFVRLHPLDRLDSQTVQARERGPWVRISVEGRTRYEAGEQALEAIDLLRGIWNFGVNRRIWAAIVPEEYAPVNTIRLGPLHSLHHPDGRLITPPYWFDSAPFRVDSLGHALVEWKDALETERVVLPSLTDTRMGKFLARSLVRYARALDVPNPEIAFVLLWGLMERLVGSEAEPEIIRCVQAVSDEFELEKPLLQLLRRKRHALIHEGTESHQRKGALYILHRYVTRLLQLLVDRHSAFQTPQQFAAFLKSHGKAGAPRAAP